MMNICSVLTTLFLIASRKASRYVLSTEYISTWCVGQEAGEASVRKVEEG